ncbi:MAG: hypothetical protein WD846_04355 [Patescibacteria group bacterium]
MAWPRGSRAEGAGIGFPLDEIEAIERRTDESAKILDANIAFARHKTGETLDEDDRQALEYLQAALTEIRQDAGSDPVHMTEPRKGFVSAVRGTVRREADGDARSALLERLSDTTGAVLADQEVRAVEVSHAQRFLVRVGEFNHERLVRSRG